MEHIDAGNSEQQIPPNQNQWAAPALQLVSGFRRSAYSSNTDEIGEIQAGSRDDRDLDECSSLEDILQIIIDRDA